MSKVIVSGFSLSIDGFGAGPEQSLNDPLGKLLAGNCISGFSPRGDLQVMIGKDGGPSDGVDDRLRPIVRWTGSAPFILGPQYVRADPRSPWPDASWKGLVGRQSRPVTRRP